MAKSIKPTYTAIYTDPDFPLNKDNIFFSSKKYASVADFKKKSGFPDCEVLMLVKTDKEHKYELYKSKKSGLVVRLIAIDDYKGQIYIESIDTWGTLTVRKGVNATAYFKKTYKKIGTAKQ